MEKGILSFFVHESFAGIFNCSTSNTASKDVSKTTLTETKLLPLTVSTQDWFHPEPPQAVVCITGADPMVAFTDV